MKPPDEHSTDLLDALRRDRDRWAQMAMEQAEYIRQLEDELQACRNRLDELTVAEEEHERLPRENDYQALVQWLETEKHWETIIMPKQTSTELECAGVSGKDWGGSPTKTA